MLGLLSCAPPATPVRETYLVSAAGSRLFVRTMGAGRDTIVVLHGGPGLHSGYLVAPMEPIARSHTVILVDGRGRGHSDALPDTAQLTVQDDVDDLAALQNQLGLSRFWVVAHHYGALVAVDYALAHPGRVAGLVLLGPMIPRALYRYDLAFRPADSAALSRYRLALAQGLPDREPVEFCRTNWGFFLGSERETDSTVIRTLAPALCEPVAPVLKSVDWVNGQVTTALANWDYRARVESLSVRTLIISGNRDPILTHAARTWAHQVPGGRVLLVDAAAQFPWIGAQRKVTRATEEFLAGRWPEKSERPDPVQVASPDDPALAGSRSEPADATTTSP